MNPPSAEIPLRAEPAPADGWGWKKFLLILALVFAAHLAFVFLLGAKKTAAARVAANVPVFRLADNRSELVRLTDPTLFALPHSEDFVPVAWSHPAADTNSFHYTEPPSFLPLAVADLGATFRVFMQTNRLAVTQLNFKPPPQLVAPSANLESVLPQNSTWQLAGEIARRKILKPFTAPTLAFNDILSPSRVQLLVEPDGNVISAVLLETSGYDHADQQALELARALRFAPADKLMFGEILFNWHTVPVVSPP